MLDLVTYFAQTNIITVICTLNNFKSVLACLLFLCSLVHVYGQVDYRTKHWAFGKKALLSFDDVGISAAGSSPLDGYLGSSCYSNKTGDLVLSTNGNAVYGPNNELLNILFGLPEGTGQPDAIIIPKNTAETQFYIFIIQSGVGLRTVDVDIESKSVLLRPDVFNPTGYAFKLTAVKHCFSDAYWLIFPDNASTFYSFLVKPNSISLPVISTVNSIRGNVGDFVSSHDGTKLALSSYLSDWVELYDFDKKCGIVSNARPLKKIKLTDDRPHGISFSPDDSSVYVAWSYQNSNIYQYSIKNIGAVYNAFQSAENINDVLLGLDGNLYINVHENDIPSRRIHVIRNPNILAGGNRTILDIASLPMGTNGAFEFPTFISNHTGGGCQEIGDFDATDIRANGNRCLNSAVYFNASIVKNTYDSIRWDFDDIGSADNFSSELQVIRSFGSERMYRVKCYAFYCSFIDTFHIPLDMKSPIPFSLGSDSTLCYGDSILLEVPQPYDTFMWADGNIKGKRIAKAGTYVAITRNATCVQRDTITISQYPDIWTELKQEYFICDLEQETTLLDAGEGFNRYKWIPTGDTTQWIIVQNLGEYIVIVDAFTGCKGNGSTIVKRRCDMVYYIPNAFSPNGDNLNDYFKVMGDNVEEAELHIYNRWGELIYTGSVWDGSNAPQGLYLYHISIKGYRNKSIYIKNVSGLVHLIR